MKQLKFYKCKICGNVVAKLVDSGAPLTCCGQAMEELKPNTVEAAVEKHLPVLTLKNGVAHISVGSVAHPMEDAHYINFIAVETDKGYKIASLSPHTLPETNIFVGKAKVLNVFEYCKLHGLWKTEVR